MYPDVHLVIQLQSLDQKITALDKEVATLPKHIATIEKALESHNRKLEADKAALSANQKDRKRLEGEIQPPPAKDLQAPRSDAGSQNQRAVQGVPARDRVHRERNSQGEDRILELMTESEPLDQNVKKAEKALAEEKKQVDAEKVQARERTAVDQKDWTRSASSARSQLPSFPRCRSRLMRRSARGSTTVRLSPKPSTAGAQAARLTSVRKFLQDLRKRRPVDVLRAMRRFLYYNPPVRFEDAAAVR